MATNKDELFAAKQSFKFDRKEFTEEIEDKCRGSENNFNQKLQALDDEMKKLRSKNDSLESKLSDLSRRPSVNTVEENSKELTEKLAALERKLENFEGKHKQGMAKMMSQNQENGFHGSIFQSEIKKEKDCKFKAFCATVENEYQMSEFIEKVKVTTMTPQKPTHVIWSYKAAGGEHQDADDNNERGASEKILEIINQKQLNNVAVVVCRWYGGEHIGPIRWQLMEDCTLECLAVGGYIESRNPTNNDTRNQNVNKKTMYITDSTAAKVDIHRMIPGRNGHRDQAPTLDAVQRKLKTISPSYKRVIIQSGINDLEICANSVVEKKITAVLEIAKTHLPQSEIYMTSIVNRDGSANTIEINRFIEAQTRKYHCKHIDTTKLGGKKDCFRDRKHPNERGTAEIVLKIKEAIGLKRNGFPQKPPVQQPLQATSMPWHPNPGTWFPHNQVTPQMNMFNMHHTMMPRPMMPRPHIPPQHAWGMIPRWN